MASFFRDAATHAYSENQITFPEVPPVMKATIRIVTPAAATAAAALLLTACAEKPVRIPGGAFVEEPYQGETVTRTQTQTIPSNGTDTMEAEIIYIDTDVPVGPVEEKQQAGQQDGSE